MIEKLSGEQSLLKINDFIISGETTINKGGYETSVPNLRILNIIHRREDAQFYDYELIFFNAFADELRGIISNRIEGSESNPQDGKLNESCFRFALINVLQNNCPLNADGTYKIDISHYIPSMPTIKDFDESNFDAKDLLDKLVQRYKALEVYFIDENNPRFPNALVAFKENYDKYKNYLLGIEIDRDQADYFDNAIHLGSEIIPNTLLIMFGPGSQFSTYSGNMRFENTSICYFQYLEEIAKVDSNDLYKFPIVTFDIGFNHPDQEFTFPGLNLRVNLEIDNIEEVIKTFGLDKIICQEHLRVDISSFADDIPAPGLDVAKARRNIVTIANNITGREIGNKIEWYRNSNHIRNKIALTEE